MIQDTAIHALPSYEMELPERPWLALVKNRPEVRCSPGYMVYLQDTPATCFYYLKEGRVKSFIQSEEGGERLLRVYRAGSIFGQAAFFDELPRVSSAMALSPCAIVPIDRELVELEFACDPSLAISMIQYLSRTVRLLSGQLDDMAFHPAIQRLARQLLIAMDGQGKVLVTQEELASSISASRVTVSRSLSDLSARGWVALGYGKIEVKNQAALEHFSKSGD